MAVSVGIDLGTTNSVLAVLEGGDPTVVANAEGSRTTPSVVAFKDGEILVGEIAKRQAITNPDKTVRSIKRHIGTDWSIDDGNKRYTPQEVSAHILMKLKRDAEAYLGEQVKSAVITVPAYFNDAQRQATKEAGQIAGLDVLRIVNEPTAAALAYGLDKLDQNTNGPTKILVFDLGGGTCDVSILEIGGGVFEVKSTSGDTKLGGDDWDKVVIEWLTTEFRNETGIDLSTDKMAVQRLKKAAETAKMELSTVPETELNLPFVTATPEGPLHLEKKLTRTEFEKMTEHLTLRIEAPLKRAVSDADITTDDIDHVVLVGGSTRMPAIQAIVERLAGKSPHRGVNPDEAVADGAAIQSGVLTGDVKDILLLDVTPLTLGVETKGSVMTTMIERNTTIPTKRTEIFTTAEDDQMEVDIHVLQGERAMSNDNKSIGKFRLTGIPPEPMGIPQIEVSFDIDADGIVAVHARDIKTGRNQSITITGGTALSDADLEKMINDAAIYADEDQARKKIAEVRNRAEQVIHQTETLLHEKGERMGDCPCDDIETALSRLQRTVHSDTDNTDAIEDHIDKVLTVSSKAALKVR